ncbi:hypothetical protein TthTF19_05970 [Thermus thermophilus]
MPLHFQRGEGVFPHLQEVDELHVFQLVLAGGEGLEEGVGVAAFPETKTRIADRIRPTASSGEVSFLR